MTLLDALAACAAGVVAAFVNAVAGGGSLLSFPLLAALGLTSLQANVTNTVALTAGNLSGAYAQRHDLRRFSTQFRGLMITVLVGTLAGAVILVSTGDRVFRIVVPFLILMACGLLAAQERIKRRLAHRVVEESAQMPRLGLLAVGATAVYGGYFGAGIGIILLAVLGTLIASPLNRLNALKQALQLAINGVGAVFFAFTGEVHWGFAGAMAVGCLAGGHLGGRVAGRVRSGWLRVGVIVAGLAVAISFWL